MKTYSITDEQYRAFIGDKKAGFYVPHFRSFEKRRNPFSWNWSAFFFTWIWAAYRKLYAMAALYIGLQLFILGPPITTIIVLATPEAPPPPLVFLAVVMLIASVLVASLANKMYHRQAIKKIGISGLSLQEESQRLEYLHKVGGTNRVVVWILVVIISLMALGIIAALVVPRIVLEEDNRVAEARRHVERLVTALERYRLDNFTYPSTEQGLNALTERPSGMPTSSNWGGPYVMPPLPTDPWGHSYQYQYPGHHSQFDVYSFGADGQLGGEGANAEVGNWRDL